MKVSIATIIILCLAASHIHADDDSGSGNVPKSVLQSLGLGDLVVQGVEGDAEDTAAANQTDDEPNGESAATETGAAASPAETATKEPSAEKVDAELVSANETAKNALEIEEQKRRIALLIEQIAHAEAEQHKAEQQLITARETALAAEMAVAEAQEMVTAFSAEGQVIAIEYNAQSKLLKALSAVHGELNNLAESSGDVDVAQLQAQVGKLIADRQQAHDGTKRTLTEKVDAFNQLKESVAAAQREADARRAAVAAAESQLGERAAAVEAAREQLRTATVGPLGPPGDLPPVEVVDAATDSRESSPPLAVTTPE